MNPPPFLLCLPALLSLFPLYPDMVAKNRVESRLIQFQFSCNSKQNETKSRRKASWDYRCAELLELLFHLCHNDRGHLSLAVGVGRRNHFLVSLSSFDNVVLGNAAPSQCM